MQPAQIAKELGVRYILEGSTRRAGEDMRLNAQLIDPRTNAHVWAEAYDGSDASSLQDEPVRKISVALAGEGGEVRMKGYGRIKA